MRDERAVDSATLCVLLLSLLALTLFVPVEARSAGSALIVANVRVVDVRSGAVSAAMDVEVRNGRIVALREASRQKSVAPDVYDAAGAYLVPGFWDMHIHVNHPEYAEEWMLPSLLAAGVTGVRDMAGDCWAPGCPDSIAFMRDLQRRIDEGVVVGPRILAIGSAIVHGPRASAGAGAAAWMAPGDAVQARTLVRELQRRGVDFIKSYDTLPRAAYFELVRQGRRNDLPVSGHVPLSVSVVDAVRAGQISIEHAKQPLLDCSGYSRTFHETYAKWASGRSERIYSSWNPANSPQTNAGSYYQPIVAAYDPRLCDRVIRAIARSGAYYVPTLITRRFEARADEDSFVSDPRLALVPSALLRDWRRDAGAYAVRFAASAEEKRAYVRFYELAKDSVLRAHAAGVPILVGTDSPDSYCFPGTAFADEMLELRAAGLSNAAILRAATLNAAEFLGRAADFGTAEPGKIADMVLLAANPLEDIRNASQVSAVIFNGRLYDSAAIRRLEAAAAAFVAPGR